MNFKGTLSHPVLHKIGSFIVKLPYNIADMSTRSLRACMVCSIVMPGSKFTAQGCPNCDDFLEMRGNQDVMLDCTSQVFEGLITLNDTQVTPSWVAKWQRLEGYKTGLYAVKVVGIVSIDTPAKGYGTTR